ncbi:MAG: HDIG domain-containing metalloprotein [Sphaerochaetaceae bacterium]
MTREEAVALYKKYNSQENLWHHSLAVEAVMRRFARELGYDEEYWGVVGLLHDIDYEQYPDQHLQKAPAILREAGVSEATIHSVLTHGWTICTTVEPQHAMEKVLFTIDELTGLITATALMRPSKSLLDLTLKSVKKKWKTKGFSAAVDRDLIARGAQMLGMDLDKVIELSIEGMRSVAKELNLAGEEHS